MEPAKPEKRSVTIDAPASSPVMVKRESARDRRMLEIHSVKQGWLLKRTDATMAVATRKWQQRFFVLQDGRLSYYIDEDLQTRVGQVKLRNATVTTVDFELRAEAPEVVGRSRFGKLSHLLTRTRSDSPHAAAPAGATCLSPRVASRALHGRRAGSSRSGRVLCV